MSCLKLNKNNFRVYYYLITLILVFVYTIYNILQNNFFLAMLSFIAFFIVGIFTLHLQKSINKEKENS